MKVVMDDGEEAEYGPGDFAIMPPGHDAWTVGRGGLRRSGLAGLRRLRQAAVLSAAPRALGLRLGIRRTAGNRLGRRGRRGGRVACAAMQRQASTLALGLAAWDDPEDPSAASGWPASVLRALRELVDEVVAVRDTPGPGVSRAAMGAGALLGLRPSDLLHPRAAKARLLTVGQAGMPFARARARTGRGRPERGENARRLHTERRRLPRARGAADGDLPGRHGRPGRRGIPMGPSPRALQGCDQGPGQATGRRVPIGGGLLHVHALGRRQHRLGLWDPRREGPRRRAGDERLLRRRAASAIGRGLASCS